MEFRISTKMSCSRTAFVCVTSLLFFGNKSIISKVSANTVIVTSEPHFLQQNQSIDVKNSSLLEVPSIILQPKNTSGQTLDETSHSNTTDSNLVGPHGNGDRASFLNGLSSIAPQLGAFMHEVVNTTGALLTAVLGAGAALFPATSERKLTDIFPIVQLNEDYINSTENDASNFNASSSRRRRSVQIDTDLTELTAMVLSAVKSGECVQRSICLMGSRIGSSEKGKMGFHLVNKLFPESVQENQYFVTLKKVLHDGESFCDKFQCRLS